PYENNPRQNDGAVDAIAKSIAEFGFKVPIVIDSGNVIVAGHTRLKAAQKLNMEKVPCLIADDLTPEEIQQFRLIENKSNELASWNTETLNEELSELTDFNMKEFGFDVSSLESVEVKGTELSAENLSPKTEPISSTTKERLIIILHKKQAALILEAIETVGEPKNIKVKVNRQSAAIYEIVRQWTELSK
ncbi:MAG: ParB N-terminal domain-containing protein, partial [Selenomonadaceae bacterium]|nr:ParB N-terminal domain-containing protein [Selenomonadaceae bacterium]